MTGQSAKAKMMERPVSGVALGPLPAPDLHEGVKLRHNGKYAGTEDGYTAEAMEAERKRCYVLGVADGKAQERNRCRYPECTENEDERCLRWLIGECDGP